MRKDELVADLTAKLHEGAVVIRYDIDERARYYDFTHLNTRKRQVTTTVTITLIRTEDG